MDEARAGEILDALAGAVPAAAVLWRGESLAGSDVDVVAAPGHDHALTRALRDCGLSPAPQDPGQVLWRQLPGPSVVVDVLAGHAWPAMYPALAGVVRRAAPGARGLPVASPGDRVLIHAAEALAGWPLEKTRRKLAAALAEPEARGSLAAIVAEEPELASLAAVAVAGREPSWRRALGAAIRSRHARAALRGRLAARLGIPLRHPLPQAPGGRASQPGELIALSGMDGAGKSTAALGLVEAFEQVGRPAIVHWTRVAGELRVLHVVAQGVRRLLGRSGSLAAPEGEPVEATAPAPAPAPAPARRGPERLIDEGWVFVVAVANIRTARRAERIRRGGLTVVCDRWLADALVDLRIRYGRRPAAEWVLRRGYPRADHAVLLEIDDATAARRKPGDQSAANLRAMGERYAELAGALGLARVDARAPSPAVLADLRAVTLKAARQRTDQPG